MAGEVIWAAEALDDIDAIAAYIARDSLVLARRVVSAFFESLAGEDSHILAVIHGRRSLESIGERR
jgi:plasmid stabilization system protein ParE